MGGRYDELRSDLAQTVSHQSNDFSLDKASFEVHRKGMRTLSSREVVSKMKTQMQLILTPSLKSHFASHSGVLDGGTQL